MKSIKLFGGALAVVLAIGTVIVSVAFATVEAPQWITGALKTLLPSGETRSDASHSKTGTVATLKGFSATVQCANTTSEGTIKGGAPGSDESTITFKECVVKGRTEAECNVKTAGSGANTIVMKAQAVIVLLGSSQAQAEEGKEVGDLLTPVSPPAFAELEFAGSNCPTGVAGKKPLEGSVVAKTEPAPGNVTKVGKLIFPATAIKQAYKWEGGTLAEVKPGLTIFSGPATLSGEEEVEVGGGEEFGDIA